MTVECHRIEFKLINQSRDHLTNDLIGGRTQRFTAANTEGAV